jgi:hypothetical protein
MSKVPILILVAASLSVAIAGPKEFPAFSRGTTVRVVTVTGQRCVGDVLEWAPQAMVVKVATPSACGAVNRELRITPSDVLKVAANSHPFWPTAWHVVTRPVVWAGEGLLIVCFSLSSLFGQSYP